MAELNNRHFDKLLECCRDILATPPEDRISAWVGKSTRSWLESVTKGQDAALLDVDPSNFSSAPFDRRKLSEKIMQSRNNLGDQNLRDLVIDIFAWGVMSPRNARLALPKWREWKAPCIALLQGCDAVDGYYQFYALQKNGILSGLGPAYYTKIIYFLGKGDGLIMDQWTSRSINLLFGKEIIKLQPGQRKVKSSDRYYTVKPTNDQFVYGAYNEAIEIICNKLSENLQDQVSIAEAEEFIFSFTTDRKKSPHLSDGQYKKATAWRRYVESNHRP